MICYVLKAKICTDCLIMKRYKHHQHGKWLMFVIFKLLNQVYFIKALSFNGCDKVVLCHNM